MHIEQPGPHSAQLIWFDTLALAIALPFLLFPTQLPLLTFFSLVGLTAVWLLPALRYRSPLPNTPLNASLLLFSLMLFVSILVTADPHLTLSKATGLILGLSLWRYAVCHLTRWQPLKRGILAFALLGAGLIGIGVIGVTWRSKIPVLADLAALLPAQLVRLPELATEGVDANQLAGTLLIYFPILISLLLSQLIRPRQAWPMVVLLGGGVLGLTGLLLLTQSRSGWVGGVMGVLVVIVLWRMVLPNGRFRQLLTLALITPILLAGLGVALMGADGLQRLWQEPARNTAVGDLSSLSFRQEVWRWGITAVSDFPFTGTGLGTFRAVVRRFYPLNVAADYDIAHAHNIFLQTSLDIGLPGLIAYLALLFAIGYLGWQVVQRRADLRPFAIGLLGGLIALHTYGLTDAIALGAKPGLAFWFAVGLLTAMFLHTDKKPSFS